MSAITKAKCQENPNDQRETDPAIHRRRQPSEEDAEASDQEGALSATDGDFVKGNNRCKRRSCSVIGQQGEQKDVWLRAQIYFEVPRREVARE